MAEREAQVAAEEAEAAAGAERATVAGAAGAAPRPPPRPVTQLTLSMQAAVWAVAPAAGGVVDDVARTNINQTIERSKRPRPSAQARFRSYLGKAPRADYNAQAQATEPERRRRSPSAQAQATPKRRRRSPSAQAQATELESVVRE